MNKKYYYIYKTTHIQTGKVYIGQKTSIVPPERDKGYMGGGILVKKAIKKYGKETFLKTIIWTTRSKESLNRAEIVFITLYKSIIPRGYNISTGGDPRSGYTEEWKERIRQNRIGRKGKKNGLPLYVSLTADGKCTVKVRGKHLGTYPTIDIAIQARDVYMSEGRILKGLGERKQHCLIFKRSYSGRRPYVVRYNRKYQGSFTTQEEAEAFQSNFIRVNGLDQSIVHFADNVT